MKDHCQVKCDANGDESRFHGRFGSDFRFRRSAERGEFMRIKMQGFARRPRQACSAQHKDVT